jgi:polar amino acid transport system substrate-binding protein
MPDAADQPPASSPVSSTSAAPDASSTRSSRPTRRSSVATLLRLLAIVMVASLVAVACSDTGNQTAPSPTSSPTTTATPAPVPDCGNPVASFAPTGGLPAVGQMPAGSQMAAIVARGRLIAGVSADTLLFGFRDPESGQLQGFDIDMVHQVAQAILGDPNKVEFKVLTYAQRIPALSDGSVDMVADVMTINCARWSQISFSTEYFAAGQKVLVRTDSTATGIADLNGRKVCAATGSTNIDELTKYPAVVVVGVDDVSDCLVQFQQGTVDAITADDTVLAGFVKQDPYAKVVGPQFTSEPYGLGVAKTHPEMVTFINALLANMRADGTWTSIYNKWLPPPAPAPPPAVYGRTP